LESVVTKRDESLSVIKNIYNALAAGRMEVVSEVIADTFVAHEPASLPYGGDYHGLAGFKQMLSGFTKCWRGVKFDGRRYLADDDCVFVCFQFNAKGRESGVEVSVPMIELWRVEGGKAVELTVFMGDTKAVCDALERSAA
jgi:ketosteroid isomerase-like protein